MRDVAVQHETLQTASCRSVALRAPCVSTPSTGVSTPSTDVSTPSTPSGAGRADGVVPRLAEALFSSVAERRGQARVPGEYSRGHSDYSGCSHGILWVLPPGVVFDERCGREGAVLHVRACVRGCVRLS